MFDVLLVRKTNLKDRYWIYPTAKGRIVVRPWTHEMDSKTLCYREISTMQRRRLRLLRSRPVSDIALDADWFTPASKVEAYQLGLSV